jgi:hypothetical protein
MSKITLTIGVLLILLGLITYGWAGQIGAGHRSWTALIPTFFGIIIAAMGLVAENPARRKHAMHAAVAIALFGFGAALGRLLTSGKPLGAASSLAQLVMVILCGLLVALGVRSFIMARRSRAQAGVEDAK